MYGRLLRDRRDSRSGVSSTSRLAVIAVLIACAAGGAVRYRVASSQPMWRDEAQTVAIARLEWPVGIVRGLAADGNSPLFYLAEHWVVGEGPHEARDRSLSVIAGIAVIALAALLAQQLGGGAIAAAIVLAASPLAIDLGSQARPYGALTAAGLTMAVFAVRIVREREGWFGYGAAAVVAFYLHAAAGSILIAAFAFALLLSAQSRQWLIHHVAIAIALAPGLVFFAQQVGNVTVRGRFVWAAERSIRQIARGGVPLLAGAGTGTFLYVVATAAGALVLFMIWRGDRGVRLVATATTVALLLTATFSWFTGALESRYGVAPSALLLTLAAAAAARWRWLGFVAAAGYVTFAALDAGFTPPQRSSARDVAAFVASHAAPSDLVIVVPDVYAVSLNYYMPRTLQQIDAPSLGRVERIDFRHWWPGNPAPVDTAIRTAAAARRRAWLIASEELLRSVPADLASNPIVASQWRYAQHVIATYNGHYASARPIRFTRSLEPAVIMEGTAR